MNLLLDTHVWIWSQEQPELLGRKSVALLEAPENRLWVSAISTLELAQFVYRGRLRLKGTLQAWVRHSLAALRAESLELSHEIGLLAYALPGDFHPDPADRVLMATALHAGLTVLTADERMLEYSHVRSLNARR